MAQDNGKVYFAECGLRSFEKVYFAEVKLRKMFLLLSYVN